ncbi:TPA: hypothetical protein ACH3X2_001717 [Trebouxia sp. C0005]
MSCLTALHSKASKSACWMPGGTSANSSTSLKRCVAGVICDLLSKLGDQVSKSDQMGSELCWVHCSARVNTLFFCMQSCAAACADQDCLPAERTPLAINTAAVNSVPPKSCSSEKRPRSSKLDKAYTWVDDKMRKRYMPSEVKAHEHI